MTVGEAIAWVVAHAPMPTDTRPLGAKADELAQALGWNSGN